MRDGALLAEAAPDELMARYHKNTLEDVFLELCRRQPPTSEDAKPYVALSSNALLCGLIFSVFSVV